MPVSYPTYDAEISTVESELHELPAEEKQSEPYHDLAVELLHCKTATTGYARGSQKAMPMSGKDKPPTVK